MSAMALSQPPPQTAAQDAASSVPLQQPSQQLVPQSCQQLQVVSPQLHAASGQTAADVPPVQLPKTSQVSPVVQESPSSHGSDRLMLESQVLVPSHE